MSLAVTKLNWYWVSIVINKEKGHGIIEHEKQNESFNYRTWINNLDCMCAPRTDKKNRNSGQICEFHCSFTSKMKHFLAIWHNGEWQQKPRAFLSSLIY